MGVAEPQPLKWTQDFSMRRIISIQHFQSISTQHLHENYVSDTSLSGVYNEFIFHLLK